MVPRAHANERIRADTNDELRLKLLIAWTDEQRSHSGENIDDKKIIKLALRRWSAERTYEKSLATLRAAKFHYISAKINADWVRPKKPDPAWEQLRREQEEADAMVMRGMVASGFFQRVDMYEMLGELTLQQGTKIYTPDFEYSPILKQATRDYLEWQLYDPSIVQHEIISIHSILTPATYSLMRSTPFVSMSGVMNLDQYTQYYKYKNKTTEGLEESYAQYLWYDSPKSKHVLEQQARQDRMWGIYVSWTCSCNDRQFRT